MPPSFRFLVVSLGNPAPYHEALHSAGHFALSAARKALAPEQPHFTKERFGTKVSLVSESPASPFILAKSPTLMNVSGPWVLAAWRQTLEKYSLQPEDLGLVVVHDELDIDFGFVRRYNWENSARGQNGVKSVKESMGSLRCPRDRWARIAVGIDRPRQRASDIISNYVLSPMSPQQKDKINTLVGPRVVKYLRSLHNKWRDDYAKAQASSRRAEPAEPTEPIEPTTPS